MNKKLNYEAPEMEVVKVRMEGGIMTLSEGSSKALNVQTLDSSDIYGGGGDVDW